MRMHTLNRRKIQDATKGAKLRGDIIGGGGKSLTSPKHRRPRGYDYQLFPARMASSCTVLGIHHRMAKDGVFSGFSRDIVNGRNYVRNRDGSIRKIGA